MREDSRSIRTTTPAEDTKQPIQEELPIPHNGEN